jgi:hypothetical protein
MRVDGRAERTGSLAVHDPDAAQAAGAAFREVSRQQFPEVGRTERVQV